MEAMINIRIVRTVGFVATTRLNAPVRLQIKTDWIGLVF